MIKEERRKKKYKKTSYYYSLIRLFFVFLFSFFFSIFSFANEDERPLRTVQTSVPEIHFITSDQSLRHPATHPLSLLTEENLQKPLTQHYIAHYTTNSGILLLNAILERGNIYLPFILNEVEKRGLPPELAYLPIIESGFQITARSRSGAVGLWQFMLNSISPFDMKVTEYIDERRDFIKSTVGALQKLEDNYNTLGSWELALAAYNVGLGAVTRMVQRAGTSDYWELCEGNYFRQETEHFVPKLLAACYVISNPRKYNINIWREHFEWATIPLLRQVSLDVIAEEADINKDLLRRLNAQWLHGISPHDNISRIVVPLDKFDEVSELLEREDLRLIQYNYHIVRQGDTLWGMSRHYGTPLDIIEQHNPGVSSRYLKLGETIIIPIIK